MPDTGGPAPSAVAAVSPASDPVRKAAPLAPAPPLNPPSSPSPLAATRLQSGAGEARPTPATGIPRPLAPETAGESASLDQEMLDLVARFDSAVRVAQQAFANGNCEAVARAAEAIAEDADSFGFRRLGRMARCVQQAGRHEDLGALRDLLPDLVTQVERNRIAIQKELH